MISERFRILGITVGKSLSPVLVAYTVLNKVSCYITHRCENMHTIIYFTTSGHLFFKISRFILGVELPYFAYPSKSISLNWVSILGFCSSAVEEFFKKPLLEICIFCVFMSLSIPWPQYRCVFVYTNTF